MDCSWCCYWVLLCLLAKSSLAKDPMGEAHCSSQQMQGIAALDDRYGPEERN